MRVFATSEQWAAYPQHPEPLPANADAILSAASLEVARLTQNARFDVANDVPTDPKIVQALQDATCAQANFFAETGDLTGASGQFMSMTLGSFSASRNTPGGAPGAAGVDGSRTAADTITILTLAGLIIGPGSTW